METKNNTNIDNWLLYSALGREILAKERTFYAKNIEHIFGKYSLQIGLPEISLFQGNKIVNHFHLDVDIFCKANYLPFDENSIDLIIMPHFLELHNDYIHILDEVYRILAPNGVVIISCFNSHSILKICKKSQKRLQKVNFINLNSLKDELIERKLAIIGGKFFSYCPPFRKSSKVRKFNLINKIGDRWLPTFANSYTLICRKNVTNIKLIDSKKTKQITNQEVKVVIECQKNS